jgi:hypothetical protein
VGDHADKSGENLTFEFDCYPYNKHLNYPLNVELKSIYEEDPMDVDLGFGLNHIESYITIVCMKTLDDA